MAININMEAQKHRTLKQDEERYFELLISSNIRLLSLCLVSQHLTTTSVAEW